MPSDKLAGTILSLFRIVAGLLFACHGAKLVLGAFGGIDDAGGTIAFGVWPSWWAGVIELVGGGLVLVGLATRAAAFLCSGAMAYAYFVVHQPEALWPIANNGELSALYCWIFLLIAVAGAGPWSIDGMIRGSRE